MTTAFHLGASHLLFFTLLCPIPRSIMPSPHFPSILLPFEDLSELQQHQQDHCLLQQVTRAGSGDHPHVTLLQPKQSRLRRAQRDALATRILTPLTGGPSVSFRERRQGENGGKKNEALTSIAGELQAVSREKGGFGFRFGRKRWTDWRRKSLRQN